MNADQGTIRDLEILPSAPGKANLFVLLDQSKSRTGGERLRARIEKPLSDRPTILATQEAIQFLKPRAAAVRAALDRVDIDEVERYVALPWSPSRYRAGLFRLVEGTWLQLRYPDLVRDVRAGLSRLLTCLSQLEPLLATLGPEPPEPPELLASLGRSLSALLTGTALASLHRHHSPPASTAGLLRLDRIARTDARPALAEMTALLGDLEALLCLSLTTLGPGWALPEIEERPGRGIECEGLTHPFLPKGVPNDLALGDSTRVILLTGPNMAGKTTFMRAAALAVYLAHLGGGVPAKRFRTGLFGSIFASIQIADNMQHHESFYLAEVRRVKALVELLHRGAAVFAIVDEPFRGTNIHDGTAATEALVAGLSHHPSAVVVVSTHITEVAETIGDQPRVALWRFEAELTPDGPRFDYRLEAGVSKQRLGMELLRREGVLDLLAGIPRA